MIKKYEEFVVEQIDDFHDDFENSKKRIRLFTKFDKIELSKKDTGFMLPQPKKKFQPKIKKYKKTNNKGIF